jgi:hypothetical protein
MDASRSGLPVTVNARGPQMNRGETVTVFNDLVVLAHGEGRWQAPQPEGPFTCVEFHIDDIPLNVRDLGRALETAARTEAMPKP